MYITYFRLVTYSSCLECKTAFITRKIEKDIFIRKQIENKRKIDVESFGNYNEKHHNEQSDGENSCDSGYNTQMSHMDDLFFQKQQKNRSSSLRSSYSDFDSEFEDPDRKKLRHDDKTDDDLSEVKRKSASFETSFENSIESIRKTVNYNPQAKIESLETRLNILSDKVDDSRNKFNKQAIESEEIRKS